MIIVFMWGSRRSSRAQRVGLSCQDALSVHATHASHDCFVDRVADRCSCSSHGGTAWLNELSGLWAWVPQRQAGCRRRAASA
eukprot:11442242-Heterocapsa_arctica.AAC.1